MTPDDANTLTMEKLHRAMRAVLEARAADGDFWASVMALYGVQQVRFSRHLPDDQHVSVMAAVDGIGQPATLILPESWRRHLPPLPRLLDGRRALMSTHHDLDPGPRMESTDG